MKRRILYLALATCSLALTACTAGSEQGAEQDADGAPSPVSTPTGSPAAVSSAPSPTSAVSTATEAAQSSAPAETGSAFSYPSPNTAFTGSGRYGGLLLTPTGNIGCDLSPDYAYCGVLSMSDDNLYPVENPLGPGTVPAWSFNLNSSDPRPEWRGDPLVSMLEESGAQTLEYGQIVQHEDYICSSATEALTCWNTSTGVGLELNRDGYTVLRAPSAQG